MKRKVLVTALLVLCLAVIGLDTAAYFTADEIATNVITAGSIKIDLIEKDAEGNDFVNPTGIMPGAVVDKIVTVKNTGDNPAWVRIKVEKSIELAQGESGEADTDMLSLDLNREQWTEHDGYYYYNNVLRPGAVTEPLFRTVTFDTDMGNMYQNCVARIVVGAQATQVAHNGDTVLDAAGWPAEE